MIMIKIPRLISKATMSPFCYDDCLATYLVSKGVPFEYLYFSILSCFYNSNNINQSISDCIEPISIKSNELNVITGKLYVSHYEKDIDSYNTIKDLLNNKRSIVINMLGSECKWDWRYKEIDNGGHAFFIMAIEEEEEMFECMDPYYDIEYGELRLQEFDKGCQDFYCINYTESNYMLDDKDALIRTLIHLLGEGNTYKSLEKFAFDIRNNFDISKEIIDYSMDEQLTALVLNQRMPLLDKLREIENNRVRFAIVLKYLANKYVGNEILEIMSKKMLIISEKWNSLQLVILKKALTKSTQGEMNIILSERITNAIKEERQIVECLIKTLNKV